MRKVLQTPVSQTSLVLRQSLDCIVIDTNYDSAVFNAVLADIPANKSGLVQRRYELPASAVETTIAAKITDMLGEKVLVVKPL